MGFYMSPGVYTNEIDVSNIVGSVSSASAGTVGYALKGSLSRKLITSPQNWLKEYGNPVPGQWFGYSALAYLAQGNQLTCVRVVNGALYGGVQICQTGGVNAAIPVGVSDPVFDYHSSYPNVLFNIFGKDPGSWNNGIAIEILNINAVAYTFDIQVLTQDSDGNWQPVPNEKWTVSRKQQLDGYGRQQYLETAINGFSQYIIVSDNTAIANTVMPLPQATVLALANGSDGVAVTNTQIEAGWALFADPEQVDVRILIEAGNTDPAIALAMQAIAEGRKDCVALFDMPYAQLTSVDSMVAWRQSLGIDSSYCALYAPWLTIQDQFSDSVIDVPPSGYAAGVMAYTDYVSQPWYAPAGFNRGNLNVLAADVIFNQGDRDTLYSNGINMIQTWPSRGTVIWGQKTLQVKASALDRLNVRRMLIVLEKSIAIALQNFAFEPNNDLTRFRVTAMCTTFLDTLAAQGAFQTETGDKGYQVVCDTTNNTPAIIDDNQLNVDIYVKPSRSAEFIQLSVIITNTGVNFAEIIAQGVAG